MDKAWECKRTRNKYIQRRNDTCSTRSATYSIPIHNPYSTANSEALNKKTNATGSVPKPGTNLKLQHSLLVLPVESLALLLSQYYADLHQFLAHECLGILQRGEP
jgi:hypothetical protein